MSAAHSVASGTAEARNAGDRHVSILNAALSDELETHEAHDAVGDAPPVPQGGGR